MLRCELRVERRDRKLWFRQGGRRLDFLRRPALLNDDVLRVPELDLRLGALPALDPNRHLPRQHNTDETEDAGRQPLPSWARVRGAPRRAGPACVVPDKDTSCSFDVRNENGLDPSAAGDFPSSASSADATSSAVPNRSAGSLASNFRIRSETSAGISTLIVCGGAGWSLAMAISVEMVSMPLNGSRPVAMR